MALRRRALLLSPLLAVMVGLLAPGTAVARDNEVTDADVQLRLARDSSLIVQENLTFKYDGSYEASYRDIPLEGDAVLTDATVSEDGHPYKFGGCTSFGCIDNADTYGVESIYGGARIVWHHKASDETRTFTITYRVIDAVVAYDDVIDVGFFVWGSQWDFKLDHLTASFSDPALDTGDEAYNVFAEPRDREADTSREDAVARLEADDILAGHSLALRVTLPRGTRDVSGARVEEHAALPDILDQEQELTDTFNRPWNKAKRFLGHHALLMVGLILALALGVLQLLAMLAKEHPVSVPEHYPEPPDDAPPALAYGLAHEGEDSENTVLATLLDLSDRGFYDVKQASTDDEKMDIAISVAAKRPSAERLEVYEKEVMSFFDDLLGDKSVALSKLHEEMPSHSSTWRGRWETMTQALDNADVGHLGWDRDLTGMRALLATATFLSCGLIALMDYIVNRGGHWLLPAGLGLIGLIVLVASSSTRLKRLAPSYAERAAKWEAFAKWTKDFPRLKDDPPATIELWQRILIYGVAFGTAERMIKSGRIPEPVKQAAGNNSWTYYAYAGGFSTNSLDGGSFGSEMSSQVAPESSSSGGGFSGGGGGFSGGGGGGSW